MLKKLVLILFAAQCVFAQAKEENLYSRAFRACLEKEISSFAKFSSRDFARIFVLEDTDLTRDMATEIGRTKIEYLNEPTLVRIYKTLVKDRYKERGAVPVIKIFPLADKAGKLQFAYNNYWLEYHEKGGFLSAKKRYFSYALEGGCHADIGFDPAAQKFVIKKVKLWGV